ncbi:MAG: hypothetical protein OEQ25_13460 [Gammaproteobacteria bacterium]|nr:hypothetical protein [Gammaproteobacteria bacterium]MDH3508135.1 hypothetical protein [Gammaproteobacteria bacterium]
MKGEEQLANFFLSSHPEVAARLLESMSIEQAGEVLECAPANVIAPVLGYMLPTASARCAERLSVEVVTNLVEELPGLTAATLLRHFSPDASDAILGRLAPARAAALRLLLRYPQNAVGAWMEPSVLTLPDDCTAEDAVERVEKAEYERPKIFVLDRARQVKGAVSGQILLRARARDPVTNLLEPSEALWARETLAAATERDIWEKESEAPVVNRMKEFVGVVSYADLRRGSRQLVAPALDETSNADIGELAELFLAGLEGAWQSMGEIVHSEQSGADRRKK